MITQAMAAFTAITRPACGFQTKARYPGISAWCSTSMIEPAVPSTPMAHGSSGCSVQRTCSGRSHLRLGCGSGESWVVTPSIDATKPNPSSSDTRFATAYLMPVSANRRWVASLTAMPVPNRVIARYAVAEALMNSPVSTRPSTQ
jgi:hypothetical protein